MVKRLVPKTMAAIVAAMVISAILLGGCSATPPSASPPQQPEPQITSPSQESTSESGEIDWSQVTIREVRDWFDSYWVLYSYPPIEDSCGPCSVFVKKSEYSPEAVKEAIREDITKCLAKMAEAERLKEEAQKAVHN